MASIVARNRPQWALTLAGPDAAKFLQGLVTNNVDKSRETPFYAAFLDARGRMLWDVFIWTFPGLKEQEGMTGGDWACYIEVDAGEVQSLVKHLKRHKLRSKIAIKVIGESSDKEDRTGALQVWADWGSGGSIGNDSHQIVVTMEDPRFVSDKLTMRRSLIRPFGISSPLPPSEDVSLGEYTQLRYNYGIPEGQEEILRESALPMEFNVDLSQGIDFKKGCYVGQELTIRTKHTGVVRKRVLPVKLSNGDARHGNLETHSQNPTYNENNLKLDPAQFYSADIKLLDQDGSVKKGRAAGKLISICGNVGLALCRLEMMTSMKISAEGGSWKPGMEFGVADRNSNVVKVKPLVRDEWVTRVRDIWDKKRTRI
ncbi:ccr4 associated factor [Paraconiothyrium brasiliense]|uniref:Iron-sulfur cluster assembly factor IBA57 homolog, mitochondrial n=1 Tax=Paraconiothyrium brasiliense TaxID=300254 RepID=A0ABR3QZT8_9PLEO